MTNEELDVARAAEAAKIWNGSNGTLAIIAARLAREGWMPPAPVDPDIAEAEAIWFEGKSSFDLVLEGIKRGRALAAAEAKPGVVWSKFDFVAAKRHPVGSHELVCVEYSSGSFAADFGANIYWPNVAHYAEITPPEVVP